MTGPTIVSGTVEDLLGLAEREIAAGRAPAAEGLCRELVKSRPEAAAAWRMLAFAQATQHRYGEAIRNIEKALERSPRDVLAHELLLKILLLYGQFQRAARHAERLAAKVGHPAILELASQARAASRARQIAAQRIVGRADLRDVTFAIPVYADSPDRVRNLRAAIAYLNRHVDAPVLVLEDVKSGRQVPAAWTMHDGMTFAYEAVERNDSPYFHKTWMLNRAAEIAKTDIVAMWDADVIADPVQCLLARDAVVGGREAAFAYNGLSIDIDGPPLDTLLSTLETDELDGFAPTNTVFGIDAAGGALLVTKRALARAGGYNENIVCWGLEDREFLLRLELTGIAAQRTPGPLWHLHHARTVNSSDTHPFWQRNLEEFRRTQALDRVGLEALVATGHFRRPLASRADLPT